MLVTTSLRLSPDLRDAIEALAERRTVSASTLMRDILQSYISHRNIGLDDIDDHVRFDTALTLKTLYLTRFIAESIDRDQTGQTLKEAEDFIKQNGLDGSRTKRGDEDD